VEATAGLRRHVDELLLGGLDCGHELDASLLAVSVIASVASLATFVTISDASYAARSVISAALRLASAVFSPTSFTIRSRACASVVWAVAVSAVDAPRTGLARVMTSRQPVVR
jgi:hypothetical protein